MIRFRAVMGLFYRRCLRPLLFRIDPERAHRAALALVPLLPSRPRRATPLLRTALGGIPFPNPLGLAAGFDKEGRRPAALARLGFGHVEVGTVTPRPQEGNPPPRLFRIPGREALVNRMGFNNPGAAAVARSLGGRRAGERPFVLGVNAGKQRQTPIDEAAADYGRVIRTLLPFADYFVVNVSSPNTPGLRLLEEAARLGRILDEIREETEREALRRGCSRPPLLVKLSPDLSGERLEAAAAAILEARLDGLLLTNTTADLSAAGPGGPTEGGLSGRPLARRALASLRIARRGTEGRLPLVAAGGIFTGDDAYGRIRAGASLVQIYTALVYEGPGVPRAILGRLARLLAREGFRSVAEAVGTEERA